MTGYRRERRVSALGPVGGGAPPGHSGFFDLDNASWAFKTREFLERAEAEGRAVWVCDDLPRSFVLVGGQGEKPTVYISQLSSATLLSRAERNSFE